MKNENADWGWELKCRSKRNRKMRVRSLLTKVAASGSISAKEKRAKAGASRKKANLWARNGKAGVAAQGATTGEFPRKMRELHASG